MERGRALAGELEKDGGGGEWDFSTTSEHRLYELMKVLRNRIVDSSRRTSSAKTHAYTRCGICDAGSRDGAQKVHYSVTWFPVVRPCTRGWLRSARTWHRASLSASLT